MVAIVFMVALLNFAVGFALALFINGLDHTGPAADPSAGGLAVVQEESLDQEQGDPGPSPEGAQEEIPQTWLDSLEQHDVAALTLVEESIHALRLKIVSYREQLVDLDQDIRKAADLEDKAAIQQAAADFKRINTDWADAQSEAAQLLSSQANAEDEFHNVVQEWEQELLDYAARIRSICDQTGSLDFEVKPAASRRKLAEDTLRLVDMAHQSRDRMHDALVAILAAGGRLDSFDSELPAEGSSELHNRLIFESSLRGWRSGAAARHRAVTAAIADLDRFSDWNARLGVLRADQLLQTFRGLVADLLNEVQGSYLAARWWGQSFVVLFSHTDQRPAIKIAERIRQAVETTPFKVEGGEAPLTASCAVATTNPTDSPAQLFERLHRTLARAKDAGRNRTSADAGDGPIVVDPLQNRAAEDVVRTADAGR